MDASGHSDEQADIDTVADEHVNIDTMADEHVNINAYADGYQSAGRVERAHGYEQLMVC